MTRQELISSREYWSTMLALNLWRYNGSIDDDSEKWEKMADAIVDDSFMKAMEEYRTQCDELPGDDVVNKQAKVSCKGNSHAMRYHHMLEQFREGAKWMRSLASPLLASKDARIRELEEKNNRLNKANEFLENCRSQWAEMAIKLKATPQPKIQMLTACGMFEINPMFTSATLCKNCGKEKALHVTPPKN